MSIFYGWNYIFPPIINTCDIESYFHNLSVLFQFLICDTTSSSNRATMADSKMTISVIRFQVYLPDGFINKVIRRVVTLGIIEDDVVA